MNNRLGSLLWQAKVPLILACVVGLLVVFALRAHERRQCRESCLGNGFAGAVWSKPVVGEGQCDCITRDGRTVAAPQTRR
jgi:hypothetical protein